MACLHVHVVSPHAVVLWSNYLPRPSSTSSLPVCTPIIYTNTCISLCHKACIHGLIDILYSKFHPLWFAARALTLAHNCSLPTACIFSSVILLHVILGCDQSCWSLGLLLGLTQMCCSLKCFLHPLHFIIVDRDLNGSHFCNNLLWEWIINPGHYTNLEDQG